MFYLGHIFYVALLFTNAIAILSEDRFLARIGWSSRGTPATNSGFGNDPSYDAAYGGGEGVSMKTKAINLIGAVRTLMRLPLIVANVVVIFYEILLG
ncbi:uncharacterized protein EHS24_000843 [Apiotrichum porosum]|uniref:Protein transport protein yos1 n=1 Tax=Apiotrichum porosum TaxID=105984 RepID=A0A427YBH1_9TREE|nr:uncharacterized protein EHS24_000843 [Apiotrichum porosum]RSH88307.1 hypothetical protein EHS24_000843 [Apiotrichum porosum]